ncbi:hypothetical protein [Hyphomonas chukchiensis]|uniref:hypothetical protein n=1 Tax=Hyphomonas chukchiensis TaxID=1280947 RepID=UPI0030F8B883
MTKPTDPGQERAKSSAPNRLRDAIDKGDLHDKIDNFDPAAAPLGTDDEAAGTTSLVTSDDSEKETRPTGHRPPAADRSRPSPILYATGVGLILLIVLLVTLIARQSP